jgi:hypothetical protein
MEAKHDSLIAEVKDEISQLKQDADRLHLIATSQFMSEQLRTKAEMDRYWVLNNIRKAELELSRLENEQ